MTRTNVDCRQKYKSYVVKTKTPTSMTCARILNVTPRICVQRTFSWKVRKITSVFKAKTWAIEDEDGSLLVEIDQVTERWRQYCEQLYKNSNNLSTSIITQDTPVEPDILEAEIVDAVRKLKANKSAGRDTIYAEELKHIGRDGWQILLKICNQIWNIGHWIND